MGWTDASNEDRKALYRAVQGLRRAGRTDWPQLYAEALPDQTVGIDYQANFRAGRISRKNAAQIAAWMAERFPDAYAGLESETGLRTDASARFQAWEDYLAEHGRYEGLSIVRLKREQFGLVTFARVEPVEPVPLKLGELFCFELDSPIDGYVTAFQGTPDGRWHPLPLSHDGKPVAVSKGKQLLPFNQKIQQPIPLSEESEIGVRRFVMTVRRDSEAPSLHDLVPLEDARNIAMVAQISARIMDTIA